MMHGRVDSFTRGALAEGLGQRAALAAIPLLRQIIEEPGADEHLRSQAVLALGLLDDPATETTLIQLIQNESEDPALRGMAAEYLPSTMSDEARRFLRDLLRRERPPAPIIAGALRALGWSLDREALPLLLRYCQDELTTVVQAAIAALADLGDASVAPMLVRITQNPNFDHALRLQAVGTLLRIGGESYRPLLRTYLEHSVLPLQLQALEHLIETTTQPNDLLALLADRTCPLTLRLRLNEHLAGNAGEALLHILEDDDDEIQLRCRAAETLARARAAKARPTFIRLAERRGTASAVRLRCIKALGRIGGVESWLALSRLAEDATETPVVREQATLALRDGWEGA
jgi:HEAT repeat protein